MHYTQLMALTMLTVMAVSAQAQTPRNLDDLIDIRARHGEHELEDRGYHHYKTIKIRDSAIGYWWSVRRGQCIAVTTKDGRFSSILEQPETMCGEDGSASGQSGRGSDLGDLAGMRASSGERELEDRGYRFVNSSKGRDRIWSNWWHRSQRQCITVVTLDGRYDSITETLPADCDRR